MNQLTLQQADNKLTINLQEPAPLPLPQVFSDVKRVRGGYKVFSDKWTFYATSCLKEEEVEELEDWLLLETEPERKAA